MKVSIVTINFNNREGLQKTIESVVNQSYKGIDYIVIDGGSVDGSVDIIRQYEESISYWVSEPDKGIYNAMNKGIAHASGDYCLFLNSGDSLHDSTVIENVISLLVGDLVIGQVMIMPERRVAWADVIFPLTLYDFVEGGPVPHQGTFIKRTLFDEESYDEQYKIVSDWKFFMNQVVFKQCAVTPIQLTVSDFESGGISSDRYACDLEREAVLKELLPPAIYQDYQKFVYGENYSGDTYDRFFSSLKKYNKRCARWVYAMVLSLVKVLSPLFKSLSFSQLYHLKDIK